METNTPLNSGQEDSPATPNGNGAGESRNVTPQSEGKSAKTNLYQIPEFQRWQAAQDQRFAQLERQLKTLSEENKTLKKQGLSELDQMKLELEERDRILQELAAEREAQAKRAQMDELKKKDIQRVARIGKGSFTKEQVERLMDANTYDEMMDLAVEFAEENASDAQERVDANTPYVPEGRPSTPKTRWEADYEAAKKAGDGKGMISAILSGF